MKIKNLAIIVVLIGSATLIHSMERAAPTKPKLYFELLPAEIRQEIAAYDAINRLKSIRPLHGVVSFKRALDILPELKKTNPALLKNDIFVYTFLNLFNDRFLLTDNYEAKAFSNYIASLASRGADQWLKDYLFLQAVLWQNESVIRKMIQKGAHINAEIGQQTSLLKMAKSPINIEKLKLLIESGANINQANKHGKTPLMEAVAANNLPAVKYLLERGADATMRDSMGRSALFAIGPAVIDAALDVDLSHSIEKLKQIISALIAAGSDINAQDADGQSVLQALNEYRNEAYDPEGMRDYDSLFSAMIEVLKSKGAR